MFWYIEKYVVAFNQFFATKKLQMRFQNKSFLQKLSKNFAFNFAKKMNYNNDNDKMIFYDELKKLFEKFRKILKRSMKHEISIKYRRKWINWSKTSKISLRCDGATSAYFQIFGKRMALNPIRSQNLSEDIFLSKLKHWKLK